MKPFLPASVLLALTGLTACNVVPRVDITPAYGQFELDGDFGASDSGVVVKQDLDDFGLDDEEGSPYGRATLNWLNLELAVSAFQTEYSGDGTTTASITIDGETISAGTDVDTDLDMTYFTGALTYDFIPGDTVDLGLGVGVTVLDFDLELVETGTGTEVSGDEVLPLPELAARAAVRFGPAGVFARVGYVTGEYGDFDGTVLDADVSAQLRLLGDDERLVTHLVAGYRVVAFDFDYEDGDDEVEADFDVSGPYVGLTFSF